MKSSKKRKMTRSKKAIFAGFLSAAMVAQSVSAFAAEAGGEYLPDVQTQTQEAAETTVESTPAAEPTAEIQETPAQEAEQEVPEVQTEEVQTEEAQETESPVAVQEAAVEKKNIHRR